MKEHNTNTGTELLSLLKQQRYLYHQLKMLTDRQQQLTRTNSPELLLEVISGRRKLIEKLQELNDKLQLIKANWQQVWTRIEPEHKMKAKETANQIQEIIGQILAAGPSQTTQNLPLEQGWKFDELFTEQQS